MVGALLLGLGVGTWALVGPVFGFLQGPSFAQPLEITQSTVLKESSRRAGSRPGERRGPYWVHSTWLQAEPAPLSSSNIFVLSTCSSLHV